MTSMQLHATPPAAASSLTIQGPLNYGATMATSISDVISHPRCQTNQSCTTTPICHTVNTSIPTPMWNKLDPTTFHSAGFPSPPPSWTSSPLTPWGYPNLGLTRLPIDDLSSRAELPPDCSSQFAQPTTEQGFPNQSRSFMTGISPPASQFGEIRRTTEDSDSPSDFSLPNRSDGDPVERINDINHARGVTSQENNPIDFTSNPFCAKALFHDLQVSRAPWDYSNYSAERNWSHHSVASRPAECEPDGVMLDLDTCNLRRSHVSGNPTPTGVVSTSGTQFAAAAAAAVCVAAAAAAVAVAGVDASATQTTVCPPRSPQLCPNTRVSLKNPSYEVGRFSEPVYHLPPQLYRPPYAAPYAQMRHFSHGRFTPHGPHTFGYGMEGARRKNATRESTTTLKVWLQEHIKNPYPTKGEKIMLAIITKMTLTQVSTWFANARRRLKKENKMSWTSKTGANSTSNRNSPKRAQTDREIGPKSIEYGGDSDPEDEEEAGEDLGEEEHGENADDSDSTLGDDECLINRPVLTSPYTSIERKACISANFQVCFDNANHATPDSRITEIPKSHPDSSAPNPMVHRDFHSAAFPPSLEPPIHGNVDSDPQSGIGSFSNTTHNLPNKSYGIRHTSQLDFNGMHTPHRLPLPYPSTQLSHPFKPDKPENYNGSVMVPSPTGRPHAPEHLSGPYHMFAQSYRVPVPEPGLPSHVPSSVTDCTTYLPALVYDYDADCELVR